jgi:hypothetical protein
VEHVEECIDALQWIEFRIPKMPNPTNRGIDSRCDSVLGMNLGKSGKTCQRLEINSSLPRRIPCVVVRYAIGATNRSAAFRDEGIALSHDSFAN